MEEKFCSGCGKELIEVGVVGFDSKSGRAIYRQACINPQCPSGCGHLTGHKFSFWTGICKLCGGLDAMRSD